MITSHGLDDRGLEKQTCKCINTSFYIYKSGNLSAACVQFIAPLGLIVPAWHCTESQVGYSNHEGGNNTMCVKAQGHPQGLHPLLSACGHTKFSRHNICYRFYHKSNSAYNLCQFILLLLHLDCHQQVCVILGRSCSGSADQVSAALQSLHVAFFCFPVSHTIVSCWHGLHVLLSHIGLK